MSTRRCRDCAHVQPCGIWPQYKRAWDKTYHHLTERQGEGAFLPELQKLLARDCKHFEPASKPQKVLPINTNRDP